MHPVLALVALDARLQGPLSTLRTLGDELAPDLGYAGALAAGVEAGDGAAKLFVHLVTPVLGKILSPSPLTRNQSLEAGLGLAMDIPLGRGISRSIETIPAPERPETHSRFPGELVDCWARYPPAVELDGLGFEGFEFEDYLEASLSFSDRLLAIDSAELSK